MERSEQQQLTKKRKLSGRYTGVLIVIAIMCVIMIIASDSFLKYRNVLSILQQASVISYIAIGMTAVIIAGGIDLSVGSIVALSSYWPALLMVNYGIGALPLAILLALAVGTGCGLLNGFLIAKLKLQPFLVTMGTMNVYRGLDYIISNATALRGLPREYIDAFSSDSLLCILILVAMVVIFIFLLNMTKYGRYLFAIGGNEVATDLSGINVNKIKIITYSVNGLCAAVCGLVYVGRVASAVADAGSGYELNAIAAAAIGGASLSGGKGSVVGAVLGAIILAIVSNALTLLKVQAFYQTVMTGVIIIIAVIVDRFSSRD